MVISWVHFIFILYLFFVGCGHNEKKSTDVFEEDNFRVHRSHIGYKVKIPYYFRSTTSLNNDASSQFQNVLLEEYLIIIHEPKEQIIPILKSSKFYNEKRTNLDNYKEFQLRKTFQNIRLNQKPVETIFSSKLGKAYRVEFCGRVHGVNKPMCYFIAFYEGKKNFYYWVGWTLASLQKEKKALFEYLQTGFTE